MIRSRYNLENSIPIPNETMTTMLTHRVGDLHPAPSVDVSCSAVSAAEADEASPAASRSHPPHHTPLCPSLCLVGVRPSALPKPASRRPARVIRVCACPSSHRKQPHVCRIGSSSSVCLYQVPCTGLDCIAIGFLLVSSPQVPFHDSLRSTAEFKLSTGIPYCPKHFTGLEHYM